MITNPRQHGIYGAEVAGPVFREIADKCFASRVELHQGLNEQPKPPIAEKRLPNLNIGAQKDLQKVLQQFDIPFVDQSSKKWAVLQTEGDTLNLYSRTIPEEGVPNVVGMGLKDALYILENRGLKVVITGVGKVVRQSIIPGTRVKGQTIRLTLR
ncbi:MAG: PASTA domain-containing protein [Bacteroidota bacterium]